MLDRQIVPHKGELIREAFSIRPFSSFADLGGCWAVNGGYAFHAINVCGNAFSHGFIVDQTITALTRERAARFPTLQLVRSMLGSHEARDEVSNVDAVIMFDILLHQVSPDWDQVISEWAQNTNMLIIYNQNWLKSQGTVRFVDHGLDWYKKHVHFTNPGALERWFEVHDEFDRDQGKPKRDVHNHWQWGITAGDLVQHVTRNGFDLVYMKRYGPFVEDKPWIVNDGFIFTRSEHR